jgi:undecaprenyl diphosphate synthase
MELPVPHSVACIMDGNRRWAKAQGLSPIAGHEAGERVFHQLVGWVVEKNIAHLCVYAFSTENWKRTETEVAALMQLLSTVINKLRHDIDSQPVRVQVVGERSQLPATLQRDIALLEEESMARPYSTTVWVALSYGGRAEIVTAVNQAIAAGQPVDESTFNDFLWTAAMPDPDLVIRTGGEQRLSNFLTWRSVYSELFFTETLWPAFTKEEFMRIVTEYGTRQRRYGK